jgi:4-hydroxybenzoyl-CoA thioesterase/acyl-CoA thioester hydrolase
MSAATITYRTQRRVEWRDTDAAGIVHFSAFFVYMEQTEHEFLRSRGLDVVGADEQGSLAWPRVSATCDYRGPARYNDVLDVELLVDRIGDKSVSYSISFTRTGASIAVGKLTTACCRPTADGGIAAVTIPDWYRSRLQAR